MNNFIKSCVLFFLLFVCAIQPARMYAQNSTIHFIYFSDTNDSEIGKSSEEADRYFINNFLPMLKRNTTLNVKSYCYNGTNFQRAKLVNVLNTLQTNSNDAIFFYYTGHGFNDGGMNDFPTLTLGLRADPVSSRTKSLLSIYNALREKPHRLLLVMAEACNAVYGSRSTSGNYTGAYDAFEGDASKWQNLFVNSNGDYLMSSCVKGEKSYCPTGGLGYFTKGFRDALEEKNGITSMSAFLDKVAKNTTNYASCYAGEEQHPHWLSGDYSDGKSHKPSKPMAKFKSLNIETLNDSIVIKVTFSIYNMKGKEGCITCYFYDSDGNALKDTNSRYYTADGYVATQEKNFIPSWENTIYTDLRITIPKSELHQSGSYSRMLKVHASLWDKSSSEYRVILRSNDESFTFVPNSSYLKVNGSTTDKNAGFSANGGRQIFYVSTSASSYETWGVPSWCRIEDKSSGQFTLVCESNNSRDARNDYMKVKIAGKDIRIDISQEGKSGPAANIENVWVDHNVMNGMWRGMNIHVRFSTEGIKNRCVVVAAFYYADNTTPLRNPFGGNLTYNGSGNIIYDPGRFENFLMFVPYSGLYLSGSGMGAFSFDVIIQDEYGNQLDRYNNVPFTYCQ